MSLNRMNIFLKIYIYKISNEVENKKQSFNTYQTFDLQRKYILRYISNLGSKIVLYIGNNVLIQERLLND